MAYGELEGLEEYPRAWGADKQLDNDYSYQEGLITKGWTTAKKEERELLRTRDMYEIYSIGIIGAQATRYADNLGLDSERFRVLGGMMDGSLTNTFRHTFGMVWATERLGPKIAKDCADAHEGVRVNIVNELLAIDPSTGEVGEQTVTEAIRLNGFAIAEGFLNTDSYIDQVNNREGRHLGVTARISSNVSGNNFTHHDLAEVVVDAMQSGNLLQHIGPNRTIPSHIQKKLPEGFQLKNGKNRSDRQYLIVPVRITEDEGNLIKEQINENRHRDIVVPGQW